MRNIPQPAGLDSRIRQGERDAAQLERIDLARSFGLIFARELAI